MFGWKSVALCALVAVCMAAPTHVTNEYAGLQHYAKIASCSMQDPYRFPYASYNLTLIRVLNNTELHVQGFAVADHTREEVNFAFRGTVLTDLVNWASDVDIRTSVPDFDQVPEGSLVHRGFYSNYMAVRDMVHEAYKLASDLYPTYKYVMIGHSLGGAIATLCAIDVHTKFGVEPTLYTFASPRVLNPTMAQWANLKFPHLRVVNQIDIVPKLPTEVMGFRH
eukprot:Colp12_sorted_trinity150504_noHs@14426